MHGDCEDTMHDTICSTHGLGNHEDEMQNGKNRYCACSFPQETMKMKCKMVKMGNMH